MGIPGQKWTTFGLPFHVLLEKQTPKCFFPKYPKNYFIVSQFIGLDTKPNHTLVSEKIITPAMNGTSVANRCNYQVLQIE